MGVAVALVHCVVDVDDAGGLQHEGVLRHRLHHRRRVVRVDDHGVYLLVVATLEMKMFSFHSELRLLCINFRPERPSRVRLSCPSFCARRRDTASAPW